MKLAFAENSHVACFDHEWHDSQLKNIFSQVASLICCINWAHRQWQALVSPPQINCKRVFAKRSLSLLLKKRFVKSHQKMSLTHRNRPCRHAYYRTTTVRCTQLCSWVGIVLGYCALSFTYPPNISILHIHSLWLCHKCHIWNVSSICIQLSKNPVNRGLCFNQTWRSFMWL